MIVNLLMFVLAIRIILTHNKKKFIEGQERQIKKYTIKTMVGIIWLIIIFGLTWLFGALTISGAPVVFQYLFIITNGFQGFYFFLFVCIINKDGRDMWVYILTLGKLRRQRTTVTTSRNHNKERKDATISTGVGGIGGMSFTNPSAPHENYFQQFRGSSTSSSSSNTGLPNDLEMKEKTDKIDMSLVQKDEEATAKDEKSLMCAVEQVFKRHSQSPELEQGLSFKDGIASSRICGAGTLHGFSVPISIADMESSLMVTESKMTDDKVEIIANPATTTTGWQMLENSPSVEEDTENAAVEQEMPRGQESDGVIARNQGIENGGPRNTEGSNATTCV